MFDITCCKTQPFPSSRSDKNVDTDLKSAVWATWRKKKKTHKSMLLIPALWHRPQKPQKRQLSIQPWTFNRNLSKLHWWKEIMIGKGFCWDRLSSSTKLVLPAESESHPLIIHYRSKLGWLQNLKHPLCSMCSAFVCLLVDHTKEKSGLCMN